MQYNKELIQKIIPTLSFQFPYELDDFAENFYFENYITANILKQVKNICFLYESK